MYFLLTAGRLSSGARVESSPVSLKELGSRVYREASPTISSRYRSTSHTSSGSFPLSERTFHVPMAWVTVRGLDHSGPRPRLPYKPHCTGLTWIFLWMVSLMDSSLMDGRLTLSFRPEPNPETQCSLSPTPGWGPGNAKTSSFSLHYSNNSNDHLNKVNK